MKGSGAGFWVEGSVCRVQGQNLGFRAQGVVIRGRVEGLRRVQGSGVRVQVSGSRVRGEGPGLKL